MKHSFIITLLCVLLLVCGSKQVAASENPLAVPNNKFGIHILFTEELRDAATLVNSNGGEWGYALIPIQAGDRDLLKWQKFMDEAGKMKLIPILRLATEGDYFNTKVWRKPKEEDILDFANFLNSLVWPIKNRYIIVFNEPNRGDEWGGTPNPAEYAQMLSYAVSTFKSTNQNFYIISAGMDNAAANIPGVAYNQYEFLSLMNASVPGIFDAIDGLGSHSYPNPAFAQPPTKQNRMGVGSFQFEKNLIAQFSQRNHPVFITETGWSKDKVNEDTISRYYKQTFETIWNDLQVVTVTPFLLKANGQFSQFSFLKEDNSISPQYDAYRSIAKIKGKPLLAQTFVAVHTKSSLNQAPVKKFDNTPQKTKSTSIPQSWKTLIKWILKL